MLRPVIKHRMSNEDPAGTQQLLQGRQALYVSLSLDAFLSLSQRLPHLSALEHSPENIFELTKWEGGFFVTTVPISDMSTD